MLCRGDQYSVKPVAVVSALPSGISSPVVNKKSKRLARSRIPTTAVEMPRGIESLDLKVQLLGVVLYRHSDDFFLIDRDRMILYN